MLPIIYKGNQNKTINKIEKLKAEYPLYSNFLDNYFLANKLEYFINESLFTKKSQKIVELIIIQKIIMAL